MNTKYLQSGSYYEIAVSTDRSGRTSIVVTENPHLHNSPLIDIELPCKTGQHKDAFKPTVHKKKEVEIREMS